MKKKQIGTPAMPVGVNRRSNEFEDFWCHRSVSQTIMQCHKICQKEMGKMWSKSCDKVVKKLSTKLSKIVHKL
jgi:hypothetical protein